jgi:hypothetical protein
LPNIARAWATVSLRVSAFIGMRWMRVSILGAAMVPSATPGGAGGAGWAIAGTIAQAAAAAPARSKFLMIMLSLWESRN